MKKIYTTCGRDRLITTLHARDKQIKELVESVSHEVYIKMCEKILYLETFSGEQEELLMKYQQWFYDHEYVVEERPKEEGDKLPLFSKKLGL